MDVFQSFNSPQPLLLANFCLVTSKMASGIENWWPSKRPQNRSAEWVVCPLCTESMSQTHNLCCKTVAKLGEAGVGAWRRRCDGKICRGVKGQAHVCVVNTMILSPVEKQVE